MSGGNHPGTLALRRHRAGEALSDRGAVDLHLAACGACRARLRELDDEQRRFESQISFDRFSAGVERAARRPAPRSRATPRAWLYSAVAMAAGVAIVVTLRPPGRSADSRVPVGVYGVDPNPRGDRVKGGAGMTVVVAGTAGQRIARVDGDEPLAAGERLRIGYQPGGHRYVLSLSVDQRGAVTPLYPEGGASLSVPDGPAEATRYLPDSLELTGAGIERIFVVLSDAPIDVEAARRAAKDAYDRAGGDLGQLTRLGLAGEELWRSFAKP
ncbi:MAG TPA: ACP synthase [Polyangia bacterium]|nr:ACP synthase [Polyangia bacterium]